MQRMSMKSMKSLADIQVDETLDNATYFPYFEPLKKVGYAYGVYGWNASLLQGEYSGALYYVTSYANDTGANYHRNRSALGYREKAIVDDLEIVEFVGSSEYEVLRFTDKYGKSFEVLTRDFGHTWSVVN